VNTPRFDRPLFAFNWLPAAFADPGWLAAAAPDASLGLRALRRLSVALLHEQQLTTRYAERLERQRWVLWRTDALEAAAIELGAAMLSRAVCASIERDAVLQWEAVLGAERRQRALAYATQFRALSRARPSWDVRACVRRDVFELGASMLAASLPAHAADGVLERFRLRFAPEALRPVGCSDRQRAEVELLLVQSQRDGVLPIECESAPWL
jgi:hypothetical protein